jgi:hypothetical protein
MRFGTKFLIYFEPSHETEIMSSSSHSTSKKISAKRKEQKAFMRRASRHKHDHEEILKR